MKGKVPYPDSPAFKKAIEAARILLDDLLIQREALDVAIAKQQRRVAALAILTDEDGEKSFFSALKPKGLTEAVRGVLKAAGPRGLTPQEIKFRLRDLHFSMDHYKNFMASLGTTLTRLVESRQVKRAIIDVHDGKDQSVYQWIPKYGATNLLANTILQDRLRERFIKGWEKD